MSDTPEPFLLIIEEINRANPAAVFGDIFQLLDRNNGVSEYPIHTSEDMKKYISEELKFLRINVLNYESQITCLFGQL